MDYHLDWHSDVNGDIDTFCRRTGIFMTYTSGRYKYCSNFPLSALQPDLVSSIDSRPCKLRWISLHVRSTYIWDSTFKGHSVRSFLSCSSVSWTMIDAAMFSGLLEFMVVSLCWCSCLLFFFPRVSVCVMFILFVSPSFQPLIHISSYEWAGGQSVTLPELWQQNKKEGLFLDRRVEGAIFVQSIRNRKSGFRQQTVIL